MRSVDRAIRILEDNTHVQYGVFGRVAESPWFPPARFLNQFLRVGFDPCDQDGRMAPWAPFVLTDAEYEDVKCWWLSKYPTAAEDDLGVASWDDWVFHLLHGQYE